MAVDFFTPESLPAIGGIHIGCASMDGNQNDLTAMKITPGASVVGVFTQNLYPAAPVQVCREHLAMDNGNIRGLIINAGVANAGTAERGLCDARESCRYFASILGCKSVNILPFSTGRIMEYLPIKKYKTGLLKCVKNLTNNNWRAGAHAIMTADTAPKGAFRLVECGGKKISITGIAKGSGMIHPNMATMLAFVATDAMIPGHKLSAWQKAIVSDTFNTISVDGDTSTNDSFILIATGKAGACNDIEEVKVRQAIGEVCAELAEMIVCDGEGTNKVATIIVRGGISFEVCRNIAESLADSILIKTALAADDADAGRLLMAIGNSKSDFNPSQLVMHIGNAPILKGNGLHPDYSKEKTALAFSSDKITIKIRVGNKKHTAIMKTCGLTHRYIDKFGKK